MATILGSCVAPGTHTLVSPALQVFKLWGLRKLVDAGSRKTHSAFVITVR